MLHGYLYWLVTLQLCVCVCGAATVDDFHVRMTAQYNANERLRPRTCSRNKKIMRHAPDETAETAKTATTSSSLLGLRKAKVVSRHKNSIFRFCCSCRNLGAYLVSPHIIRQSTTCLQLAIAIAAAAVSLDLSKSLLCLQLRLNCAQR